MTRAAKGAVAAVESQGAAAAATVLERGGNAADAAVAGAFAQAVVDPMRCSVGGGAHILYVDSASGRRLVIDAGGVAPGAATPGMFELEHQWENAYVVRDGLNRRGYAAQVVPGFVAGLALLHERFGTRALSWSQLLEPAIELAADGFAVHPHLYFAWRPDDSRGGLIGGGYEALAFSEESRRIFLHDDGTVYTVGETLIQTDLAATLALIAEGGADAFYRGAIAHRVADDFAANGGLLSLDDLATYAPIVEEPIECEFRGHTILTESAPSVGPTILQILRILEGWEFEAWGWNSPRYLDALARAMHLALAERDEYAADPHFEDVGVDHLLGDDHISLLRSRAETMAVHPTPTGAGVADDDTTHIAVMDASGGACGITHSVGLGTGVITPGLGFMHNCHMVNFDPRPGMPNAIAPHKRGTQGGAPVIALSNGTPTLSLGSPAGSFKVTALVQVLANALGFGMPLQAAVEADRLHVRTVPPTLVLEPRFDPRAAVALAQRGHALLFDDYGARVAAVSRGATGGFSTGSDPRGDRGAAMV